MIFIDIRLTIKKTLLIMILPTIYQVLFEFINFNF